MDYPNFYECLTEARNRLNRTCVLYDGLPFHINHIDKNPEEELFDVFLEPVGLSNKELIKQFWYGLQNFYFSPDVYEPQAWVYCDQFVKTHPDSGMIVKKINDPLFNRFRPFPLGYMSMGLGVGYLERIPIRPRMEQGLISSGIVVVTDDPKMSHFGQTHWHSKEFRDCILGDHHDINVVIAALLDSSVDNYASPFDREFALELTSLDMMALLYRGDAIGSLPNKDTSKVLLLKEFRHYREVVEDLEIFDTVVVHS
jgi:hypothetical protein